MTRTQRGQRNALRLCAVVAFILGASVGYYIAAAQAAAKIIANQ